MRRVMTHAIRTIDRFGEALDRPIDAMFRHFEKRIFELATALMMFGQGMLILSFPDAIEASAYRYITLVMTGWVCCALFLTLGVARIIALALNGHWHPYGAYIRAIGASLGAIMWSQMDAALISATWAFRETPSPGIPVYFMLAIFEVISMYRALAGAARKNGNAHR